jgi:hypothetical protein
MKKHILFISLLIIFLFLISGCVTDDASFKNKFTLVASEDDTISIRLEENSRNLSFTIQYFRSDNTDFLAVLNRFNNSIEFYDINENKLYKALVIPREGNNSFVGIKSFICKEYDSILLFSQSLPEVGIIDSGGNLLKRIKYDIRTSSLQSGERPFCISNNVYLIRLYPAHESNGILTPAGQKNSSINLTVDLISGASKPSPLTYPEELTGQNVFVMHVQRVLGYDNCFVYHFDLLNGLYVTADHLTFKQVPLETNYKLKNLDDFNPSSSMNNGLNDMLTRDRVQCMYYDPFRECYYITIRKREDDRIDNSSIKIKFLYPECYILILDKNLKHMGEVHFPEDTYSFQMCFVTEKGLYISEDHVNNPEFSDDYMRFRLFTLEKTRDHGK